MKKILFIIEGADTTELKRVADTVSKGDCLFMNGKIKIFQIDDGEISKFYPEEEEDDEELIGAEEDPNWENENAKTQSQRKEEREREVREREKSERDPYDLSLNGKQIPREVMEFIKNNKNVEPVVLRDELIIHFERNYKMPEIKMMQSQFNKETKILPPSDY